MDHIKPTKTQPNPNLSTEHQAEGDARRPRDVLDRDANRASESGATIPDDYDEHAQSRKLRGGDKPMTTD